MFSYMQVVLLILVPMENLQKAFAKFQRGSSGIDKDIKALQPEDTLQLVLEAETEEDILVSIPITKQK